MKNLPALHSLPKPVSEPLSIDEFREIAEVSTGKCILLIRHAKRPPIEKNDASFGENLGLTESGSRMAQDCGIRLKGLKNCSFHASPMRRTRETARLIAQGMNFWDCPVVDAPEAGIPGLWVLDQKVTHRHYEEEGSAVFTDRYLHTGCAEGYRPISDGTRLMSDWLTTHDFGARCSIITSHDIFIAGFLQGLGVRPFDSTQWVGFLQGAALVQDADGLWRAQYCVPDKHDFANTFFQ